MYRVSKAYNMKSYTNQADELHRQANKIKHPVDYPLYTYKLLRDNDGTTPFTSKGNGKCGWRYPNANERNRCIRAENSVLNLVEKSYNKCEE